MSSPLDLWIHGARGHRIQRMKLRLPHSSPSGEAAAKPCGDPVAIGNPAGFLGWRRGASWDRLVQAGFGAQRRRRPSPGSDQQICEAEPLTANRVTQHRWNDVPEEEVA